MTYYYFNPGFKLIVQKLKGNQVYLFNTGPIYLLLLRILQKIPFLKKKFLSCNEEPEVDIGKHKGLYYKINREAYECTKDIIDALDFRNCPFINIYNRSFRTSKFEPFVFKWISRQVESLLNCLYRVSLHQTPVKVLYLKNTPLNFHIFEWWRRYTGYDIQVVWTRNIELSEGITTIITVITLFFLKLFSRGFCFPVTPKKFKIMKEAMWRLKNPVFKDDFFIDNKRLFTEDLLLYTTGDNAETRLYAYQDALNSEYETVDISKLKIPLNTLFKRLLRYHLFLPVYTVAVNFRKKQNYIFKQIIPDFHMTGINYEILLSHYRIKFELSIKETNLSHIPETILLNYHGAKSVIWNWSDMTSYNAIGAKYKSHNLYLVWGNIHYDYQSLGSYSVDKVIKTGLIFNHSFDQLVDDKASIRRKLGLPIDNRKVLAFYDESFSPSIHFTEETLLDFWQVMADIIETRTDIIAVLKPKWWRGDGYENLSASGREKFEKVYTRCLNSRRFHIIEHPQVTSPMEVIAISDINITMGMCSPSTIAILCGKIGLYYDTTGNDQHPFTQQYRNIVAFNDRGSLLQVVNRIIDDGYNPLDELNPDLLRTYDHYRDNLGLERFREALISN